MIEKASLLAYSCLNLSWNLAEWNWNVRTASKRQLISVVMSGTKGTTPGTVDKSP
jgi:hypothetical protein